MRWLAPLLLFLTFYLVSQRPAAALPAVNYTSLVKERVLDKRGLDNVFMVWTTDGSSLDALSTTCIQSVVAAYGGRQHHRVYLLANHLTEQDLDERGWRQVQLVRYTVEEVLDDTPLHSWFVRRNARLVQGKYWFSHSTDLMRFALLYKHGGLYLDTDVLVMRQISLSHVNKLVRSMNDSKLFECAIMLFEAGNPYLFEVMKTVPEHYKLLDYTSAGPRALTKAYEALPRRSAKQPPEQLAPGVYLGIRLLKAKDFWSTGRVDEEDFVGCEAVHLWGSIARGYVTNKVLLAGGDGEDNNATSSSSSSSSSSDSRRSMSSSSSSRNSRSKAEEAERLQALVAERVERLYGISHCAQNAPRLEESLSLEPPPPPRQRMQML